MTVNKKNIVNSGQELHSAHQIKSNQEEHNAMHTMKHNIALLGQLDHAQRKEKHTVINMNMGSLLSMHD
jgi:hypothetical protein